MTEPPRLPIEIGATVADLLTLLQRVVAVNGAQAQVRGSVVVWVAEVPVMVIGLAPEYESEIER